ncbi:MAG: transcriptional regulator [Deltaproteobacteria bacterium]|jgi:predicted transcriptional regulator of viral defense system|nr:transcriptional regulator [Deltaproteobacteria bacterium]
MKYYPRLIDLACFTRDDVEAMTGNRATSHSVIEAYKKKRLIESVRRDLFVTISFETKQPVANRYVIASHAAPGAYVAYHSAFEYHGLANQVYYEVYAASKSRFRTFEHYGLTYRHVPTFLDIGLDAENGVRVTDLERTVIDGINNFEKVGGLEELLLCIGMIPYLDGRKLIDYLNAYGTVFLYQKTGYILEHYQEALKLTDSFFDACRSKITKSKRYLYGNLQREPHAQNKNWALYTPVDLLAVTRKGAFQDE